MNEFHEPWATALETGPQTVIVDSGRYGWRHLAVPNAGPFDRDSFQRANRLVGNLEGAAALEVVLGPLTLHLDRAATLALTGVQAQIVATWPTARGGRRHLSPETTFTLPAGTRLHVDVFTFGLRGYLAVRGGIHAPLTLGSRSADVLSGLGPAALQSGDALMRGLDSGPFPVGTDIAYASRTDGIELPVRPTARMRLPLLPSPRADLFADLRAWVLATEWQVDPRSNRVGTRLRPQHSDQDTANQDTAEPSLASRLSLTHHAPSEPLVRGAVQLPPDGNPIIMGPDHPSTGGYPVVGVVSTSASNALAQVRPGQSVWFQSLAGES